MALAAGCGASPADQAQASAPATARVAQSTTDDPCRFFTAEAMGRAFGRQMKSSKLADVCKYQGAGTDVIVVKVAVGPEGTILRHLKGASARSQEGVEKVATSVGEAYFDSTLPVFVGRVGNHELQIETTIQPLPRDAMIAVGTRLMETLARK
jgi:hypothetical protein